MKQNITIITATYNALDTLPRLTKSLAEQNNQAFKWIVSDGGSIDGTLEYLNSVKDIEVTILSEPDFGIYDALNRAIKKCDSEYYIVIGADDYFYPNAIEDYKKAISESKADLVAAGIETNGRIIYPPKSGNSSVKGQMAYISGHSIGLAIKTELHKTLGLYSKKYPIAADQLFILQAIKQGVKFEKCEFCAGVFSQEGVSSYDRVGTITEFYRVQLDVGFNKYVQTLLLIMRILKKLLG